MNGSNIPEWTSLIGSPFLNSIWGGINLNAGELLDQSGARPVEWWNRQLNDSTDTISVNWNSRNLYDSGGVIQAINWEAKVMRDNSSLVSLDWANKYLVVSGVNSIDWGGRQLKNGADLVVLDYSGLYLQDVSGSISMNWNTRTLWDGSHGFPVMNWVIFTFRCKWEHFS